MGTTDEQRQHPYGLDHGDTVGRLDELVVYVKHLAERQQWMACVLADRLARLERQLASVLDHEATR